jgi:hypothetical protein
MTDRLPDTEPAGYLDMPPERRTAAKAIVKVLSATMATVALELPLNADVDDFRRILLDAAPNTRART